MLLQVWTKCLWEAMTLLHPSHFKTLLHRDSGHQLFFSGSFPARCWFLRIVISQEVQSLLCRDSLLFQEIGDPQVSFNFPGFSPPGGSCPLLRRFPFSLGVSFVLRQMTPLSVANETLVVAHMFSSFTWQEVNFIDIHSIGVSWCRAGRFHWLCLLDIAVPFSSEFPEPYHISVELSCLIKPLLPFPSSLLLSFREGSHSHHDF